MSIETVGYTIGAIKTGQGAHLVAESRRQKLLEKGVFKKVWPIFGATPLRTFNLDEEDAEGKLIYGCSYLNRNSPLKVYTRKLDSSRSFAGVLPALWSSWRKPKNRIPESNALDEFVDMYEDAPIVAFVTKYVDTADYVAFYRNNTRVEPSGSYLALKGADGETTYVSTLTALLEWAGQLFTKAVANE